MDHRRAKERRETSSRWCKLLEEANHWRKHLDEQGCDDELDEPKHNKPKRIRQKYLDQLEAHLKSKSPSNSISVHDAVKFKGKVSMCQYLSKSRTCRPKAVWDSGATHGVHNVEGLFTNQHRPVITHIRGISGATTQVEMAGTCEGLHGVLHMPSCTQPVIAIGQFLDQIGGTLEFTNTHLYLKRNGKRLLVGERNEQGLYDTCMTVTEAAALTKGTANINMSIHAQVLREKVHSLHRSLGHIGKTRMMMVLQRNNFTNMSPKDLELLLACDACQREDKKGQKTKSQYEQAYHIWGLRAK